MVKTYVKIIDGKVSAHKQSVLEESINSFNGHWVEAQDEFSVGDLYDETNGFSVYTPTPEELEAEARLWRDDELQATDSIVAITDHSNHTALMSYREELRDWPSTDAFPNTKPIKP
jgi:hypothetical protein